MVLSCLFKDMPLSLYNRRIKSSRAASDLLLFLCKRLRLLEEYDEGIKTIEWQCRNGAIIEYNMILNELSTKEDKEEDEDQ